MVVCLDCVCSQLQVRGAGEGLQGIGRLGFVAQLLVWLKPHLDAWGAEAAVAPGTVGRLPETAVLTLKCILVQLKGGPFLLSAKRLICLEAEAFRTDARCEDGRVVLGGWEVNGDTMLARWFSVEVSPSDAPFLFRDEKSQCASTSAELLASLAALFAFGWLQRDAGRIRRCLGHVGGLTILQTNICR